MNKPTMTTITAVALLGLAKSKLGSGALERPLFSKQQSIQTFYFDEMTIYEAFTKIVWDMTQNIEYFLEIFEVEEDEEDLIKAEIRDWGFDPDAECVLLHELTLKDEDKRKGHGTIIYQEFENAVKTQTTAKYIVAQSSELDGTHSLPFWLKMGFSVVPGTGDYPLIVKEL